MQGAAGQALSMQTCLSQASGQRRSVVHAYWNLQQRAAVSHICDNKVAEFQDIAAALASGGGQALALQALAKAAQLEAVAAGSDARADEAAAQCTLMVQIGQSPSSQPRILSTLPFTDTYPVPTSQGSFNGDSALRRLTARLQAESSALGLHTDAVTASNQLAQASLGLCRSGQASSAILDAIDEQAETSLRFAAAAIMYNQDIAEYAARTSSGDRFLAALMVR